LEASNQFTLKLIQRRTYQKIES